MEGPSARKSFRERLFEEPPEQRWLREHLEVAAGLTIGVFVITLLVIAVLIDTRSAVRVLPFVAMVVVMMVWGVKQERLRAENARLRREIERLRHEGSGRSVSG